MARADSPHDLFTWWRLRARRQLLASHERCVASVSSTLEARNVEPGDPERRPGLRVRGLWQLRALNASCVLETLRGVELHAYEGAVTAVMGPRHAGKSSLVVALLGLEEPCAGTISVLSHVRAGVSHSSHTPPNLRSACSHSQSPVCAAVQEMERGADCSWALRQMGFMLDENCYYELLNTEQHLYLIGRMRGVPEEDIQTQAGTLRALFQIPLPLRSSS